MLTARANEIPVTPACNRAVLKRLPAAAAAFAEESRAAAGPGRRAPAAWAGPWRQIGYVASIPRAR